MEKKSVFRFRWHQFSAEAVARATLATDAWQPPTPRDIQREILLRVGIPIAEGIATARDYAIALLQVAAEVEHALMVQYLYAALSLRSPDEDAPEDYRVKVMNVAIQEMGHLATVQNLLLLTGGRSALHMQRDLLRRESGLNPIPFVLEMVGLPALAKFVAAEMPATVVKPELAAKVARLVKIAKTDAGMEPHRVGAIYAVLKWLFLPKEKAQQWMDLASIAPLPANPHLTDADLTPAGEVAAHEARRNEWGNHPDPFILDTPRTCAEAVTAIERVAAQGEGYDEAEDTHFVEFLELVDDFEAGKLNEFLLRVGKSPTLRVGYGGEGGQVIAHPYTKLWGEVFSLQYTLLVLSIYHTLLTPRPADGSPGFRRKLAKLAMDGMRQGIEELSAILVALPMRSDSPDPAGPPYDLDPAHVRFADDDELKARHVALINRLGVLYSLIEASPDFGSFPAHATAVANLREYDDRRRNLFTPAVPPP